MRCLLSSLAFVMASSAAYAGFGAVIVPARELDLGLAGLVMVAGAAFLARRR
jgi:hypothetical protein